jgi:hypothetical protein
MREDASANPQSKPFSSFCLPGFQLTHTLFVVSKSLGALVKAADLIVKEDATVHRWLVTRSGDLLEQRIVVGGTTEEDAARLRDRIQQLDEILRVRLEHHYVREGSMIAPVRH